MTSKLRLSDLIAPPKDLLIDERDEITLPLLEEAIADRGRMALARSAEPNSGSMALQQ